MFYSRTSTVVIEMIRWSTFPDPVFFDLISNSLNCFQDFVKDDFFDKQDDVFRVFSQQELLIEVDRLIKAHSSEKIFNITDFHFRILYDALTLFCDLYNDDVLGEKVILGNIRPTKLIFDDIVEIYFWDLDFLMGMEIINNLSVDKKEELSVSPSVFSIANSLKPHSEELKFTVEEDINSSDDEIIYKNGNPYPFFGD